ncbi:galactokinase [Lunatibacter salilacus]|uniref:galactokinase n=1 Tax=Lunatibacter salilacus TaxID=2483804 RepID=UPI00131E82A8|nr:galactokinase [Lunatibacter salilacus]
MSLPIPNQIQEKFTQKYGTQPVIVRSPGRINLIGEHTDYNEGFVLPAAIDKAIYFGFAKNGLDRCRVCSLDYQEEASFSLDEIQPGGGWITFIKGIVATLIQDGHPVQGFDCIFGGDIPIGAGLSSSAALENGVGFGLNALFALGIDRLDLVKISLKAEHEFAGVKCGIMDMFASMMGKQDSAIRLDCRSLEYEYFPVNLGDCQFLLCDTQVSHSLADSAYNTRREECQTGVDILQQHYPEINSLRDAGIYQLAHIKDLLPGKVYHRCAYVIQENQRLFAACDALENGKLENFGRLLYASHEGLSKSYEVSCTELDFLVEQTESMDFVLGARMMGGGFGGCTLNLIKKQEKETFIAEISASYLREFGRSPKFYEVQIEDGTSICE